MSDALLLIENNAWQSLDDSIVGKSQTSKFLEELQLINKRLRKDLTLRSDPFLFRIATNGTNEIKVTGIAGTISAGDLVIDIAPKFALKVNGNSGWDASMLLLMQYARKRDISFQRLSHVSVHRSSFVDLLAMAYLDAVKTGLADQLIQTYRSTEQTLPMLRGRLNVSRYLNHVFIRPHLLECDVDELDANNGFNNLLVWATNALMHSVRSSILKRSLNELLFKLPGKPDRRFALHGKRLQPPPQFKAWKTALDIAVTLSSGLTHTSNSGMQQGYSYVFNMERLFENFVENCLKRMVLSCGISGLRVMPQDSIRYANPTMNTNNSFFSRPDNVIYHNDLPWVVVDAKYKRLSDSTGYSDRKPINADIYEIVSALTAHNCKIGLLIYPRVLNDAILTDDQLKVWTVNSFGTSLTIGAIAIDLSELNRYENLLQIDKELSNNISELVRISENKIL